MPSGNAPKQRVGIVAEGSEAMTTPDTRPDPLSKRLRLDAAILRVKAALTEDTRSTIADDIDAARAVLDALAAEPTDAQVEAGVEVLRCGYGGAATSSVGLSYQIDSQRRLIRAVLEAARRAR